MIKHLVIVCSYFAPAWGYGGPPMVLYTLAKELVRKGKKVTVITTDAKDEKRNKILTETIAGIDIFRFPTISNTLSYKAKIFYVAGNLEKAKIYIKRADVVLFSGVRHFINWQLYKFVYQKNIPYGIFAFGQVPRGKGMKSVVKKILDRLWVKDFVKKASYRFCQTEHEREMFNNFFEISLQKTQLLRLPVARKTYQKETNFLQNFKKKWQIYKNNQILIFVGRLHYLKGVDILIRSLKPLFLANKNLKLIIVGRDDGEERNLRILVSPDLKQQIIFAGPIYGQNLLTIYRFVSCFVFTPRYWEETSLACLEALACGVPVVTSKRAEIPYLEEYKAGYIIINTDEDIRNSVTQIIEDTKKKKDKISRQAKKLVNDHFSSQIVGKKLLELLEQKTG